MAFAGSMTRGDSTILRHTVVDADGAPLDLGGAGLRLVAARRIGAPESEAVFVKTQAAGGIVVLGLGSAETRILPADTTSLIGDVLLHWELQAVIVGAVYTLDRGVLLVTADVVIATA
jgi:hypothetical protein